LGWKWINRRANDRYLPHAQGFPVPCLPEPDPPGGRHPLWRGTLATKPRKGQRHTDLAAERLLAGGILGLARLFWTLEGAALRSQTVLCPSLALSSGSRKGHGGPRHKRPGNASGRLRSLVSPENQRKVVFVAELWRDGMLVSHSVTPFVANKHLELRKPSLKGRVHVEGQTLYVDISTRLLARFVELSIDGIDAVFSDNYFDVPAGTKVTVTTPLPENWTEESTIQARSLYDSFA
jgi:hypothetical protein